MASTVHGRKLSSEFRKVPYLDHCYLTYFCATYLDITNYADDNTPHSTNINLNKVLHDLEKMSDTLFKWFTDNLLKANREKSHLLTNSAQEIQIGGIGGIQIGGMAISNSKCEKLLGIHIDNKFTSESHIRSLCKKAS